jgi:hypothetical protein
MSARYRIREHKQQFTPQKRILGMWLRVAPAQRTMQAANEIIRERLKAEHLQGHLHKPANQPNQQAMR